jgi:hypothetical protein
MTRAHSNHSKLSPLAPPFSDSAIIIRWSSSIPSHHALLAVHHRHSAMWRPLCQPPLLVSACRKRPPAWLHAQAPLCYLRVRSEGTPRPPAPPTCRPACRQPLAALCTYMRVLMVHATCRWGLAMLLTTYRTYPLPPSAPPHASGIQPPPPRSAAAAASTSPPPAHAGRRAL